MSGGSYEYFFRRLERFADDIQGQHTNPLRKAFADKCRLMAEAAHAVEWVDSCDWGEGDEDEAIRAALGPTEELDAAIEMATRVHTALANCIERSKRSEAA